MAEITVKSATPIFFVSDVPRAAVWFRDSLGFAVDFLHGEPPFYGSVSRGEACIHLRLVHQTWFAERAASEESLILATLEVSDVKALYAEFEGRGVTFVQLFPPSRVTCTSPSSDPAQMMLTSVLPGASENTVP